jgi:hypothetical protein
MALADVPGLGAYYQRRQANEAAPLAELQQASGAMGLLANIQKQQKQRQYEEVLASLGPNASEEQLAQVVSRFNPEKGLEIRQRSADKKAALDLQRETKAASLEQQARQEAMMHEYRMGRLASEAERVAETARHNKVMEGVQGALVELRRDAANNRPQPQPQIVQTDAGPMQLGRDGIARPITTADGQPVKPKGTERALPSAMSGKYLENLNNLRKAETALALIEGKKVGEVAGDTAATGKKGLLTNMGVIGDMALNAMDPAGVDTRAAIGDLGSMVIHDRSGAAVTAAEFPRLRPFIPLATDSPEVAQKKTRRFVQEYKAEIEAQREFFSQSGYKVPDVSTAPAAPARPAPSPAGGPKAGDKSKSKSGKPMTYDGSKWVYD